MKDLKAIGYCGVDIFILLSALGLSMSLSRRTQNYGGFLLRRVTRILPTYWLVSGGYGLFLRAVGRTSVKTILWTVSLLFYWLKTPGYFNWYIPGLLAFYLLAYPSYYLLKKCHFREIIVLLVSLASFPLAFYLDLNGLVHLNDVIFRIPMFLTGLLLGQYIADGRALTPVRLCVWAAGPFLPPVVRALYKNYISPCFTFAMGAVFLCLALSRLMVLLPKGGPRRWLRGLGECSLEIYLLNVIFVQEHDLLFALLPFGPTHRLYYLVMTAANILLGVGLHYLLKRPMAWLTQKVSGAGKS